MQDKRILKLLKWLAIIAAGILLFIWGKRAAYIERGYEAVGGEYLLLLLPLFWLVIERTIKDFQQLWKQTEIQPEKEE